MSTTQSTTSLEWTRVEKKPPKNIIIKSSSTFNKNHQKSQLDIEAERNYNDQMKIDKEVLVTGFNNQPAKDYWMELINKAGISTESVKNHGIFKGQSGKYFITIGFKDKMSQELFIAVYNPEDIDQKPIKWIFVHNRLTKFNSSVEKELRELQYSYAIFTYQLNGGLFEAMLNRNSIWTVIDTQDALQKFITAATQTRKGNDKTTRIENIQHQQELERHICVEGFLFKPQQVDDMVAKFMERFGLTSDDVVSHTTREIEEKWTIYIEVTENSVMRKILTSKNKRIRLSYLMGLTAEDMNDSIITWKRALTVFNEEVKKILTNAHKNKKIYQYEFADHRYRVKTDKSSAWVSIECDNDLKEVLKFQNPQVLTKKNSSIYKVNSVESMSTSMSVMSVSSGSRM